ncbi:class I lanthipeptide [Kordia sp.]|uniref:class I lanthipeptide n=1 Tax=Kordia sp. TaxID=1965332 RepID=UPI003D6C2753
MKKKSIKKLTLKKASISTLNAEALTGGTIGGTLFCQSVNICETIDFTRCNGELLCQIYDRNQR